MTKVLIVDDEVEFASTLAERLQLRGYDAKAVFRPDDALSVVKNWVPDVILLDLKMPGMSGIELLMTVRTFVPDIHVILVTGHMDIEKEIEGINPYKFDYVMKPVDIKELTEKIDKAAEKRKLNRE